MEVPSVLDVDTTPSLLHPGQQEVLLLPFGDLQLDPIVRGKPRASDIDRARKVIEWGVAHGAYFVGMGDYVDVASPSNREEIARARLYDSMRDALEEQADETLD